MTQGIPRENHLMNSDLGGPVWFEAEMTAKLARLPCRIHEVGISNSGRTYSEGKKINWKDGMHAISCILKYS